MSLSIFWLGVFLLQACSNSNDATRPDVFILAVDTLRRDHVGAYNPESPASTPHMDALAADGILFTDAFSPITVTGPAFVSMLTGLEPGKHGVVTNLFRGGDPLSEDIDLLPERFKDADYATGAFVSAFTLRSDLGLRRGFDVYNSGGDNANRNGDMTADAFGTWMGVQEGPVFAWIHFFDAHGPVGRWVRPEDRRQEWERDPDRLKHFPRYQRIANITDGRLYQQLYARGVVFSDQQVGAVVAMLKQKKRYDDALIVVVADHGEGFEERELWYDHGTSTHAEQTQIPLILKLPKNERAGTTDSRLASLLDVAPTLLKKVGLPPLPNPDGHPLHLAGKGHTVLSAESSHCKRIPVLNCHPMGGPGKETAVRDTHHALVSKPRAQGTEVEFFERRTDPWEKSPSKAQPPAGLTASLSNIQVERRERAYGPLPNIQAQTDDERMLQQLVYLE